MEKKKLKIQPLAKFLKYIHKNKYTIFFILIIFQIVYINYIYYNY